MVFTRKADDALASLVKKLDAVIADNQDKKLASFVNFLGPDADAAQQSAHAFGTQHNIQHVALVVPKDHENGPDGIPIHPDAEVTVMIYKDTRITANHAVPAGELGEARIDAIIADAAKVLN
jgi:hypothetical protein